MNDAGVEDARECARLEPLLLTREEREYLDSELRSRSPRWDLDPPQREEHNTPAQYVLALKRYAQRCLDESKEARKTT